MARFRFRLEAKLRVTKFNLENQQVLLADELRRQEEIFAGWQQQQQQVEQALEGQRQACLNKPQDLASWQVYVQIQKTTLLRLEEDLAMQIKVVESVRVQLAHFHREFKKLDCLKEKEIRDYRARELRLDQAMIDETGNLLYNRNQTKKPQLGVEI